MKAALLLLFATILTASIQAQPVPYPGDRTYTVAPQEFVPVDADVTTSYILSDWVWFRASTFSGNGRSLIAPVHLPDGAAVTGLELQYCLNGTVADGELALALTESCRPGVTCTQPPTGVGLITPGGSGCGYVFQGSYRAIDNANKFYYIDLIVGHGDGRATFGALRVYYMMTAAPAPSIATFVDVPVSHPFFRFVEALYASGGTAGCGGGRFCPEAPVTRGQLAVMLASLLGLGW